MREIVNQALINHAPLLDLVGQIQGEDGNLHPNIHQASSLDFTPPRPFVTYRMHTDFFVQRVGGREYVQVWAHDDPGDYSRIDAILDQCRIAIVNLPSEGTFLDARWIETGVDLRDDAMNTITRYIRFQLTRTTRELLS